MILAVGEKEPRIAPGAFVATSAVLIGEVTLEDGASVWYQAVLDGGQGPVWIGPRTNVQDGAVLTGTAEAPLMVGPGVSVGHAAILSGCRVEEGALIAIRAAVLEGGEGGGGGDRRRRGGRPARRRRPAPHPRPGEPGGPEAGGHRGGGGRKPPPG